MPAEPAEPPPAPGRLELLKALGDNTRYAIYLELARAPRPQATSEIARTLGLHPNTVRPHLERMRDVGLLEVRVDARGGVGRPQHRYSLAADAPSLGLEPPAHAWLARLLLRLVGDAGLAADDARVVGAEQGRRDALGGAGSGTLGALGAVGSGTLGALVADLDALGFDPTVVGDDDTATVGFGHCPFRDLAETDPAVVCGLHRGMVEGFVGARGDARVRDFRTLVHHDQPCQVDVEAVAAG